MRDEVGGASVGEVTPPPFESGESARPWNALREAESADEVGDATGGKVAVLVLEVEGVERRGIGGGRVRD